MPVTHLHGLLNQSHTEIEPNLRKDFINANSINELMLEYKKNIHKD